MPLVTTTVSSIATAVQPFADAYAASTPLQVGTMFLHFAGLLAGGGLALTSDRSIWRVAGRGDAPDRERLLDELDAVHAPVLVGLAIAFVTGAMLTLADVETYLLAPKFWLKMGLVVALLANGAWLGTIARRLRRVSDDDAARRRAWTLLRTSSALSVTLWPAITLAGVLLTTA